MSLLILVLYVLFVLSAIVLVVVVLIQEGRGGGLTDALGTGGQATFGAGARGINMFTGIVAGLFLVSAIGITFLNKSATSGSVIDRVPTAPDAGAPADPAAPASGAPAGEAPPGGAEPAPAGGTPPPAAPAGG
jgi:preprotein translocase subunit SecG